MTRDDQALTRLQRRRGTDIVDLGDRPDRHAYFVRDRAHGVARLGADRHAGIPQFERCVARRRVTDRHGRAIEVHRQVHDLHDLGDHAVLQAVDPDQVDMQHVPIATQIDAGIMALERGIRNDIAAAEEIGRRPDIDEAIDIRRHAAAKARRIERDDQADRNIRFLQPLGEPDGSVAAGRMPGHDDRRFAGFGFVARDRLIGRPAPVHMIVGFRVDAAALELLGQIVHLEGRHASAHAAEDIDLAGRRRHRACRLNRTGDELLSNTDNAAAACETERENSDGGKTQRHGHFLVAFPWPRDRLKRSATASCACDMHRRASKCGFR